MWLSKPECYIGCSAL